MSLDVLRIQGMIFHAYHGLDDDERENGQRFEVDIEMFCDLSAAAFSDRIRDTIDVRKVYHKVQSVLMHERFYLIEAIGQRIADLILGEFNVKRVIVRVRKPFAPLGGLANGTEVEMIRERTS